MRVRLATPADAPALAAIYAPIVMHTATSFEDVPPDADEMVRRLAATLPAHPWLVADDGGAVVGYAYAGPHRARAAYRWAAEVSVYVAPDAHRRGIARTLYTELLDRLTAQGYALALAGITLPNLASVAFHEALGFEPVGIFPALGFKHGAWYDVGWWTRRLRGAGPPGDLRPVSDVPR